MRRILSVVASLGDGGLRAPCDAADAVDKQDEILDALQRDLDATGLEGRISARDMIDHWEAEELLANEDDPDRSHGMIGLAHRAPAAPGPAAARSLRAAGELLQGFLVETDRVQWPVCRLHGDAMSTPQLDEAQIAAWTCQAVRHGEPHQVARLGSLHDARHQVGFHGRLPRRQ